MVVGTAAVTEVGPVHGMLSPENASAFAHMMTLPSERGSSPSLSQSPIGHKASACKGS